jgi:heme-degrading monooxygenase HmoA
VSGVATLTVVRYSAARAVLGAARVATDAPALARTPGLRFARAMGTGSGMGFSARPDLRGWALFASWESEDAWERFRGGSRLMRRHDAREEVYSVLLSPADHHGRWGGVEPFGPGSPGARIADDEPVAVLTRATIRPSRALRFWSRVAPVDGTLRGERDLLATFGFGEVPWLRQGTLSVWRTSAAMQAWAYRTPAHVETVRRTREEGWYAEELFARFRFLRSYGTLRGHDPLAALRADAPPPRDG